MKATFNGTCQRCQQFRPRCAYIHLRVVGKATQYHGETVVYCENCRQVSHGRYRLAEGHKGKEKRI